MDKDERERHAKALMNNPLLSLIFDEIRDETFTRWETSGDEAVHRECWAQIRAISKIKNYIQSQTGGDNGKPRQ